MFSSIRCACDMATFERNTRDAEFKIDEPLVFGGKNIFFLDFHPRKKLMMRAVESAFCRHFLVLFYAMSALQCFSRVFYMYVV